MEISDFFRDFFIESSRYTEGYVSRKVQVPSQIEEPDSRILDYFVREMRQLNARSRAVNCQFDRDSCRYH